MMLAETGARRISPELARLTAREQALATAAFNVLRRAADSLDARQNLTDALSPAATIRRGYSVTRINGKAVRSAEKLKPGDIITTELSDGSVTSVIKNKS